jgi:hypothetical protein
MNIEQKNSHFRVTYQIVRIVLSILGEIPSGFLLPFGFLDVMLDRSKI